MVNRHRQRMLAVGAAAALVAGVAVGLDVRRTEPADASQAGAAAAVAAGGTTDAAPSARERAADRVSRSQADGQPTRVVIPSLGVDAPVVAKGLDDGTFVAPDDAQVVGWWTDGARPGDRRGSALLAGHTLRGDRGALHDLEQARAGDPIRVTTDDSVVHYQVRRVVVLTKQQVADRSHQLFSQNVPGRLVVVTCEMWNGRRFVGNAVVTADPVRVVARSGR